MPVAKVRIYTQRSLGLAQVAVVFGARAGEVVVGGAATATTAGPGFALPPPLPPPRAAEVPRGVGEGEPLAARW